MFSRHLANRTRILFSVPSGNFGNLAAGLLAKAMGSPSVSFLAATNRNDTVPEFLLTGIYRPRPPFHTSPQPWTWETPAILPESFTSMGTTSTP